MGKGDKKTRRGKIWIGTYGRLRRRKKATAVPKVAKPKAKSTTKAKPKTEVEPEPKAKPVAKKSTEKKVEKET
ncbi:30S ribosomal protein THX [Aquimarina algiphila]|uniref:30S ribosomal protein THX n=1 Tax=Aquimarina algiphila TaxID=2047982 RepID=UPI002FE1D6D9